MCVCVCVKKQNLVCIFFLNRDGSDGFALIRRRTEPLWDRDMRMQAEPDPNGHAAADPDPAGLAMHVNPDNGAAARENIDVDSPSGSESDIDGDDRSAELEANLENDQEDHERGSDVDFGNNERDDIDQ